MPGQFILLLSPSLLLLTLPSSPSLLLNFFSIPSPSSLLHSPLPPPPPPSRPPRAQ